MLTTSRDLHFCDSLHHSEDVWDPILLAYHMISVSSFAWTILSLSPESNGTEFRDHGGLGIRVLATNHPTDMKLADCTAC